MTEFTPLRRLRSCALAIICGKPEEIEIIADALDAREKISGIAVEGVANGHIFYLGRMRFAGNKILTFYITSSLKQGLLPFAIAAGALISVLRPRFVMHTGLCAGNKRQNVRLSDVVCGDTAMSIEDGKWTRKDGQLVFMPDFETISTPVAGLIAFASKREDVHYGFYISGSSVREDAAPIFERIENQINRKVLALEMEASAFLKLCSHSQHTNVQSMGVIKGVSDLGDEDRGKDPTTYGDALRKTGEVLAAWVRYCFSSMTWEANEDNEPGARLAQSYYNNFVQRIVDAVASGSQVTIVGEPNTIPPEVKPFIKIIMPPDDNVVWFAEQGQIERIAEEFDLALVSIGKKGYSRTAYVKGDYLIDFPRTLNSLMGSDDQEPQYQALVFRRHLEGRPYFRKGRDEETQAAVLTWQEFMDMCSVKTPESVMSSLQLGPSALGVESRSATLPGASQ